MLQLMMGIMETNNIKNKKMEMIKILMKMKRMAEGFDEYDDYEMRILTQMK